MAIVYRILLFPFMIIPGVNLPALFFMNMRATKRLRAAGYQVGLLGAKRGPGMV